MTKSLAIVGAGPKAAAIAARAAVLRDIRPDRDHPTIHVFEATAPGAAWSGEAGFTSGFLRLCSPAEKDVGFPYAETNAPPGEPTRSVASEIYRRFSWNTYLAETGDLAEWVDRGREPPPHQDWARYVAWVFERAGQAVTIATVTDIVRVGRTNWRVTFEANGMADTIDVQGVVLTGTGEPRRVAVQGNVPNGRVFDPADVWASRDLFTAEPEKVVAIVGDGGAAGAIAAWLAPRLAERGSSIRSITTLGTLLPRGDGHAERRWFSDPSDWRDLSVAQRRTLLAHTESGVISLRNKAQIDAATNVEYAIGRADELRFDLDELIVSASFESVGADGATLQRRSRQVTADFLVNAIGFDPWSLLKIVRGKAQNLLGPSSSAKALRAAAELNILPDLSLPPESEVPSGLHVPGLAALARGPGMPTLGCLGLVASAILDGYIQ